MKASEWKDELRDTVKEWRDARKAFFAVAPVSMDPTKRFPQDIWMMATDSAVRAKLAYEDFRRGFPSDNCPVAR